MRIVPSLCALGYVGAVGLLAQGAFAKGPWPRMTHVAELSSTHLEAMTNYGLLSSSDRGKSWALTCDHAFLGDSEFGGALDFATSGSSMFALAGGTLAVSRDDGCDWT